jgi:hypothetical protein
MKSTPSHLSRIESQFKSQWRLGSTRLKSTAKSASKSPSRQVAATLHLTHPQRVNNLCVCTSGPWSGLHSHHHSLPPRFLTTTTTNCWQAMSGQTTARPTSKNLQRRYLHLLLLHPNVPEAWFIIPPNFETTSMANNTLLSSLASRLSSGVRILQDAQSPDFTAPLAHWPNYALCHRPACKQGRNRSRVCSAGICEGPRPLRLCLRRPQPLVDDRRGRHYRRLSQFKGMEIDVGNGVATDKGGTLMKECRAHCIHISVMLVKQGEGEIVGQRTPQVLRAQACR